MSIISRLFSKSGTAVFEFLLIVVGVLAALAVDSWQQEQDEEARLRGQLTSLVVEVEQNLFSVRTVRDRVIPRKIDRLGKIIDTFSQAESPPALDDAFIEMLATSTGDMKLWFTRSSYDALLASGGFRHLNAPELEAALGSTFGSPDILLDQAIGARGNYAGFMRSMLPTAVMTLHHPVGGYAPEDASPPVFDDGMTAQQLADSLFAQRNELLRLARQELAYTTGTWYALKRLGGSFEFTDKLLRQHPLLAGVEIKPLFDGVDD